MALLLGVALTVVLGLTWISALSSGASTIIVGIGMGAISIVSYHILNKCV